jgi:hypothetical protein
LSIDHRCSRWCSCSLEERFWRKVDRRSHGECWPWLRCTQVGGYGWFALRMGELERDKTGPVAAHRVAFRLTHGYWPEPHGLHGCDNPPCCNVENPAHVHEGTQLQNMAERILRGRSGSPGQPGGAAHPEAKLSVADVAEVHRLREEGVLDVKSFACEVGVSTSTVYRIIRGETYRGGG